MVGPRHFVHRPAEALRRYVREILFLDSDVRRVQVLMPETTPTLMLQHSGSSLLADRNLPSAIVSGLQSTARTVDISSNSAIAIVRFTEIGAAAVIKDPIHSLYDSSIAIDDMFHHSDVDGVLNSLSDSKSLAERALAVEQFLSIYLRKSFTPNLQIEVATRLIRQTGGKVSINKLTSLFQTNHSTLERRFKASVGATPKALSRLARLQNVCRLWDLGMSLTQIAYEAGFSDQPHLTHEFKRLVGSAPEDFFSQQSPRNLPTFYK
jgi:AraC-like DNA-binding protein